jgi:serine phosphatase RsbU (regulator of sigma subunit)
MPDDASLFDSAPAPLVLLNRDLVVVRVNAAWLAGTDTSREAVVGRPVLEAFPTVGLDRAVVLSSLRRAWETGRPQTATLRQDSAAGPEPGRLRFWIFRTVPLVGEDGRPALLLHRAEDIGRHLHGTDDATMPIRPLGVERTRRMQSLLRARAAELADARAQLRAAGEREHRSARLLAGLATAVSALAAAENRSDLLRRLFRHGPAAFDADALAIALVEAGGTHLSVVDSRSATGGPHEQALPLDSPLSIAVAAAGDRVVQPDATTGGPVPPLPGLRAWAALPLHAGRRPLGSLTVGWRTARPLGDDELRALEAFAAQVAEAVDRVARLEAERRRAAATRSLAEVLQRSLLTEPPQPAHLDVAVRYRPAAREAQVGGDWYDAFLSPGGALTVAVGDVTGHDRTAAAVAGQLRNMLRGIVSALDGHDPASLLATLDRALRDTPRPALATALVARVEERRSAAGERRWAFSWSNAGHPPPLLLQHDGTARLLERPHDLLLGVDPETARRHNSVPLSPGTTVLLYTDGLIEHRDATLDDGFARLLEVAPGLAETPLDQLCEALLTRLRPDLTDDIALLALRVRADGA